MHRILLTFLLFILAHIDLSFTMEQKEGGNPLNEFTRLTDRHKPTIVLATDDGYAVPTAATILSIEETTPDPKNVIVLSYKLSKKNKCALKNLSNGTTNVIVQRIPMQYIKDAKKCSTTWNVLVQARIFYQEIFNELNSNPQFLEKIGGTPIEYFIHIDSDTIVVRNLLSILESSTIYSNTCFSSTDLCFISRRRLDEEYINGVSGGVVIWMLEAVNKLGSTIMRDKLRESIDRNLYLNFYRNDKCYQLWSILRDSDDRDTLIKSLRVLETLDLSKLDEFISKIKMEKHSAEFVSFIEIFSELNKVFGNLIAGKINEILNYLIEESSEEKKDLSHMNRASGMEIKIIQTNPTEEEVMSKCLVSFFSHRYNFIMKYIFPKLDKTPQDELSEWGLCGYPQITSYKDLLMELCKKYPQTVAEIIKEFNEIVVMHFDMCYKPWEPRFRELAREDHELYKIASIYSYYIYKLCNFDKIDQWKTSFSNILKEYEEPDIIERDEITEILRSINHMFRKPPYTVVQHLRIIPTTSLTRILKLMYSMSSDIIEHPRGAKEEKEQREKNMAIVPLHTKYWWE